MKKYSVYLSIALTIANFLSPLYAQEEPEASEPRPVMEFTNIENNQIQYGTVLKNSRQQKEVCYKNMGTVPLVISNVKTSCGCTAANWSREPLASGEEECINFSLSIGSTPNVYKTATIYSNANPQRLVLSLRAKAVDKLESAEDMEGKEESMPMKEEK